MTTGVTTPATLAPGETQTYKIVSVVRQLVQAQKTAAATATSFATPQQYGAAQDGMTDDGPAFQLAVNALQTAGGGYLLVPGGTSAYLINTGVTISRGGVTIIGEGFEEMVGPFVPFTAPTQGTIGTWIYTSANITPFTFSDAAWGSSIRDIAFYQNQPADVAGWAPTVYVPTLMVASGGTAALGGGITFENVFTWNSYIFLQLGSIGHPVGNCFLRQIKGNPLKTGIAIINAEDTIHIDGVHFWPYNNNASVNYQGVGTLSPNITTGISHWIVNNGYAFLLNRADDLSATDVFAYGYQIGIDIEPTTDTSTSAPPAGGMKWENVLFDSCCFGLVTNGTSGTWTSGYASVIPSVFTNFHHQAPNPGNTFVSYTVFLQGAYTADFVNFYSGDCNYNGVDAAVSGCNLSFTNYNINDWNELNTSQTAFNAVSGSTITLNGCARMTGGNSAATTGGAGTFDIFSFGGSGSGTVNSGTASQLGYYATSSTAISPIPAINYVLTGSVTQLLVGPTGGSAQGQLVLRAPTSGGAIGISPSQSSSSSYSAFMPGADGAANQHLKTDGSSNWGWAYPIPSGTSGQIAIYNGTNSIDSLAGLTTGGYTGTILLQAEVAGGGSAIAGYANGSTGNAFVARVDNTGSALAAWIYAGSVVGDVATNGSSTTYNTTSDKRQKDVIGQLDATTAFDNIDAVDFAWKSSGKRDVGFLAQDVQPWVPNAVTEGRGEPGDSDFLPWRLDYSRMVPHLWAEVSRLRDEVAKLKGQV